MEFHAGDDKIRPRRLRRTGLQLDNHHAVDVAVVLVVPVIRPIADTELAGHGDGIGGPRSAPAQGLGRVQGRSSQFHKALRGPVSDMTFHGLIARLGQCHGLQGFGPGRRWGWLVASFRKSGLPAGLQLGAGF